MFKTTGELTKNFQFNLGVRWDMQQANGNEGSYLKLNNLFDTCSRVSVFHGTRRARARQRSMPTTRRYVETPLPLDINVRAGSNDTQTDKNFNVNRYEAPLNAIVANGFGTRNLGAESTPIDFGLKPQTVNERPLVSSMSSGRTPYSASAAFIVLRDR